ncbi:SRPBCC family protein [Pseudorhodobacter turbinis]|uniref:SRPBCC family protein n=1 Tax=Pseudorhodobacter turbinis TaxID=2500533 RepID=A0A4P8EI09_9RHOB|nr:SRPBCC family protein [Pseudorhodobacter turbinis]QCO56235.1 SRPBCC family protein [Pseudorhodobacter turbinis]
MKLTAKEDIDAPIGFVNALLTDFDKWEGLARDRGAEAERLDSLTQPGAGMMWKLGFDFRGKRRAATLKLLSLMPEQEMTLECIAKPGNGVTKLEMTAIGETRTRLVISMEIKPNTLAARLFLQTLRLAKEKVNQRFKQQLIKVAAGIEDRYRKQAKPV